MMLFLLAFLLLFLAFGITLRQARFRQPANANLLAGAYLLPALFLSFTLGWAAFGEKGFLRFSLLGFGFAGDEPRQLALGGARGENEIWLKAFDDGEGGAAASRERAEERARRLTLGELRFVPAASPESPSSLVLVAPPGPAPGLLGTRPAGVMRPWPALALEEGDEVAVGDASWILRGGSLFGPMARFEGQGALAGASAELPRRHGTLPLLGLEYPILRAAGVQQATYPVSRLEGPAGSGKTRGLFFFEPTFWGGQLFLASRDPAVQVRRGGQELPAPAELGLADGERLYALSPPLDADPGDFEAGGVRDRRSFRLFRGPRSLVLLYDSPETYVLRWSDLAELDLQPPGRAAEKGTMRIPLAMGGWQLTDKSLYFENASTQVALEALTVLELPLSPGLFPDLRPFRFTATTPIGERQAGLGEVLWLGSRNRAAVQLDFVQPPWILGILAFLLALVKGRAAWLARLSTAAALLAGGIEALLALRLLLGWQTWALFPFRDETYRLALIAFVVLPWVLLLAAQPPLPPGAGRGELLRRAPLFAGLLLAMTFPFVLQGFGLASLVWAGLAAAAAAWPWLRGRGSAARLADSFEERFELLFTPVRELRVWCLLAFAPGLLRLFLLGLGFRESVQAGERVALTLIHIPLALAVEALYLLWLWRRTEERGEMTRRELLPALLILAGTWGLPAFGVGDLGLALLNVPVFLLVLAVTVAALRRQVNGEGAWWRLPGIALGLAIFVLMLPLGAKALIRAADVALPEALSQRLLSERNYLRLLDFAYPQRLEEVARKPSEELMVMGEVLRAYTSSGLTGRGFLRTEISRHIERTALREHVPAVFVASQWGLLGGLGLALIFGLVGTAGLMLAPGGGERPFGGAWREASLAAPLGALAAATLALPSLHMLLANYRLAVFTGKNAYLLGLDSTADVLEAGILILLAALGAAAARDDEWEEP